MYQQATQKQLPHTLTHKKEQAKMPLKQTWATN